MPAGQIAGDPVEVPLPSTSSRTSCASCAFNSRLIPRIWREKKGSEKIRNSGSSMITATAPLRRVTRVRAAWFGM